jgi:hypothetical protein
MNKSDIFTVAHKQTRYFLKMAAKVGQKKCYKTEFAKFLKLVYRQNKPISKVPARCEPTNIHQAYRFGTLGS